MVPFLQSFQLYCQSACVRDLSFNVTLLNVLNQVEGHYFSIAITPLTLFVMRIHTGRRKFIAQVMGVKERRIHGRFV